MCVLKRCQDSLSSFVTLRNMLQTWNCEHHTMSSLPRVFCFVAVVVFLPLWGRGGWESRPESHFIVLKPASPPQRVGPPSARGSTPSHSAGAARCAWRSRTGWQNQCGAEEVDGETTREGGRGGEGHMVLGVDSLHMGKEIKGETSRKWREEMDRWEKNW